MQQRHFPEPVLRELSNNRTPSPKEGTSYARKHSPWTAARCKKKQRDDAEPPRHHQPTGEPCAASSLEDAIAAHLGAVRLRTPTSTPASSAHSSPAVDRSEQCDLHPAKAYIVDRQASAGQGIEEPPHSIFSLQSWGGGQDGCGGAPAAGSNAGRSAVWFGGAPEAARDGAPEPVPAAAAAAAATSNLPVRRSRSASCHRARGPLHRGQSALHHRSWPGPDSSALSARGRLATMTLAFDQPWGSATGERGAGAPPQLLQGAPGGGPGADQQRLLLPAGCCAVPAAAAAAAAPPQGPAQLASVGGGLGCQASEDDCSGFTIRRGQLVQRGGGAPHAGGGGMDVDGCEEGSAAEGVDRGGGSPPAPGAAGVPWFCERLAHAARAPRGDRLRQAQQLWAAAQEARLGPCLPLLNAFLQCWHSGGGSPEEAEAVTRAVCVGGGVQPDATTSRLLVAIDVAWQQLHG